MAQPLATPYSYFTDANGDPLSGGKIYTYIAGTTTPQNSYTDSTGITPAANPVILDSAGKATIWLQGYYKIVVKTSADVTISTTDNITALGSTGDMNTSVYDPANIQQQVVGTTAVQTLTNKTLTAPAISGSTSDSAFIRMYEDTDNGTNYVDVYAPASMAANRTVRIEDADGTIPIPASGTFTPVYSYVTPGNLTVAYSSQLGYYTKIGNVVFIAIEIVTTTHTHTTASGNQIITGLPYASRNIAGMTWSGQVAIQGVTIANYTQYNMFLEAGSTTLTLVATAQGQSLTAVSTANCPSATQQHRYLTFMYHTD